MQCRQLGTPVSWSCQRAAAQLTLELDIFTYLKVSPWTLPLMELIDPNVYSPVEWRTGEFGFQHLASGDIFSPIQLETREFMLLNERTGAVSPITPLPASVWLLGSGLLGLEGLRRRQRRTESNIAGIGWRAGTWRPTSSARD